MLSFRPATPADVDALRALLPAVANFDLSQLPTSIPAYLINVVPELLIDGKVAMSGSPMTLGSELTFVFNPRFAGRSEFPYVYSLPAGSYVSVAVIGGSVSPETFGMAQTSLQSTRAILQSGNPAQLATITREQALGDMFHVGMLGYYAQYIALAYMAGLSQKGHHQLAAGIGSFGYEPHVDYLFGIPRKLSPGGVSLNMPIVNIVAQDETTDYKRIFTAQLGAASSSLEQIVPEQMFASDFNSGEAVSAAGAIVKAAAAGQRIYEITPQNQSAVLPQIHHDAKTMAEIGNALAAGKHVTTHTDPVSVSGWAGAGYVILDPETGEGAWKIGGGQNGGFFDFYGKQGGRISFALFALSILSSVLLATSPLLLFVTLSLIALSAFNMFMNTMLADLSLRENGCPEGMSYLLGALGLAMFLLPRFLRSQQMSIAMNCYSFLLRGTMKGASGLCRHP